MPFTDDVTRLRWIAIVGKWVAMLPSLVTEDPRASLTSFLGTRFVLGDDDVRAELDRFVADPEHGVFCGPFVRLRLPFRPTDEGWREYLDWSPRGFRPHRHQAQAWVRLASRDRALGPRWSPPGVDIVVG
jgi:hypothetical protein